ncbi:hypothetical protein ACROYT_G002024 [Oculina patagonica]
MKNRFTCDVKCPSCHRRFKSSRTTIKHGLTKHGLTLDGRRLDFYDSSEETVTLPEAKKISPARLELYKSWIASLTERVGEALHPALPGKWVRLEDAFCPSDLFQHLLYELHGHAEFGPHSVSFQPHRKLPYRSSTIKISYKMYNIQWMREILNQNEGMQLKTEETFSGLQSIPKGGSLEERKAMARSSGLAGFLNSLQKRPTSMSKVVCKEKEGRATRELELIWWPNILQSSACGKFQLRLYVQKALV